MSEDRKIDALFAAIDEANADDPRRVEMNGASRAFENVYSERMTARLEKLYPDASDHLKIAARAQHLRRFDIPRGDFPQGRSGYDDWRKACRERHAHVCSQLMRGQGLAEEDAARVASLIRKERLKKDREAQALENVAALVFLEHYFDVFLETHADYDDDKIIGILGKTLCKMSPKGHGAALALSLPERTCALVRAAVERQARTLAKLAESAID